MFTHVYIRVITMDNKRAGFTLIELAAVLTLIAILAGGIVISQQLIRNSQLRAAVEESQFYTQILNTFVQKYGQLPGDFTKATSVWGAADPDKNLCKTSSSNVSLTCNGDGDGWITNQ